MVAENLYNPQFVLQSGWANNNEFEIPSSIGSTGKSWTRVTATNYNSVGGWAFTYKFGTNIKVRMFDNILTGSVPNQLPTGTTSDITVNTTNPSDNHDEPDISYHPDSQRIIVGFNDRTTTSSAIMDQRFRVFDQSGIALSATDGYATHTTLQSQWRPLIEPLQVGSNASSWLYSFTGNNKDTAFINTISSITPFAFGLSADIHMAPSIGTNRNTDQTACELPNGNFFCAWNEVIGSGRIRWRIFDASGNPTTSSYNELSAVLTYAKDEPRVKYNLGKIWLTYHHIANPLPGGGEYEGIDIYACIFDYDSGTGAVTLSVPEFPVHSLTLPGLQRKPELVLYRDRALVVFEHYPSGVVMGNGIPAYNGNSYIVGRAFKNTGRPLTKTFTISTDISNVSGTHPYVLRPDISVSLDNNKAMVCWTSGPSNNIYGIGSSGKLWARELSLLQIG